MLQLLKLEAALPELILSIGAMALLMLAFFGSQFVLEMVLKRV